MAAAIVPAEADKVGVAAAVNPDAFSSLAGSPQSQLNIGKSIFYNERINTTGSGLVQVLLVDGSTFTVGPGSDLVIDKFVYDPKKGTGQIAASFSKGVMRFVGGKISKNEGGVTVDTPAGALAIRGGIAYADFKSAKNFSFLFVFGEYVKMEGKTLYMPGYGWFMNNGQFNSRPFDANDLKTMLAALTNGNPRPQRRPTAPKPNTIVKLFNTQSLSQLISDANATRSRARSTSSLPRRSGEAVSATPKLWRPRARLCRRTLSYSTGDDDDEPVGRSSTLVQPTRGRASSLTALKATANFTPGAPTLLSLGSSLSVWPTVASRTKAASISCFAPDHASRISIPAALRCGSMGDTRLALTCRLTAYSSLHGDDGEPQPDYKDGRCRARERRFGRRLRARHP